VPQQERIALFHLGRLGYQTYLPRLRERRISHGRKIEVLPALFPGYCFLAVEAQWYAARWCAGVIGLIMSGIQPAKVADEVIEDLRKREINGLIELAKPPKLKAGDSVKVLHGPFAGHLGLYAGMRPRERVEILLQLLGAEQRVTLAQKDIEVVR
jgi:transcriptional antiterminator RfaH